jgi:hypothetical protein
MNGNNQTSADRYTVLQTFAAELTRAAYLVALRHNGPGSWLDLELDLWRALGETVQNWERGIAPCRPSL